jgi:hypothetical protein
MALNCFWGSCTYSHLRCLQFISFESGRVLSGWFCCIWLRKQVCGLVEPMYAKSHWLKGPSPVSCPIGGRSTRIEGNPSLYNLWIKFKVWVPWSGQWMFQECKLWMLEDLCVHTDRVLFRVWEREIRGRDSVSGPQRLELRKDLCFTRVFD